MVTAPTISFVLLTWNRPRFLSRCLEALTARLADPERCEIVVMDNGSTDETPELLRRLAAAHPILRILTRDKNYGVHAYKKLFRAARGAYIVEVDDDVLEFPSNLDRLFLDYMAAFPDYGLLALNVVQDEFTNGAKPGPELYTLETRDGKTIERGPTGGWCACFRKRDYRRLWPWTWLASFNMKHGEDGFLVDNFDRRLGLKSGIIRDAVCFHACGPHYARVHGHLDREIEKYAASGLGQFVETYQRYKDR